MQNIVVGYIPTPQGTAALDAAIELATTNQARVTVVNTGRAGNYADALFATAEDMDAIDAELGKAGIDHDVRQPTEGRAASEAILLVADEIGADLIVIGVRRRSPVGKVVMGSTAQNILLDASCAVLAVKAK